MSTSVSTFAGGEAWRSLPSAAVTALAGRLLLAFIFVLSGLGKIADPAASLAYIETAGLPLAPLSLAGAILIEAGAGIALILGYRTRVAATLLALFSVVTALVFHSELSDQNQFIHFSKNLAMAGGLLQVVAFGGGGLGLDARSSRLK